MRTLLPWLWLIPVLPLLAAGITALLKREQRRLAAGLALGALAGSCLLSVAVLVQLLPEPTAPGNPWHHDFVWFTSGSQALRIGWLLDPLSAVMLVMVTVVGLLILVFSVGYMAHDANFTRFFCFLSLFAGAMLGLIMANHLLLLFICWELVGLASFLLIGFWYHKPEAVAAAQKAFLTTRVGDLGLFLGLLWLSKETGTLLFYDHGQGCLEGAALSRLAIQPVAGGLVVATGIGLLLFWGAVGKSGQLPLHVWLPDAMEGPTPVSALIHAATMVAAGVFLMARVYPLLDADPGDLPGLSPVLTTIAWVGAATALFAATVATAQNDIKRILAYSTVSQLGFMMMGLGVGGVAVGMFHLITHGFFKALLFLGAGSVIHGMHDEQDIRRMGGLRRFMPVTFLTYAAGTLALAGFPLLFSGFWSKDAILHAAHGWSVSAIPYYAGLLAALLTAFYMTRQVCSVFYGKPRSQAARRPHESPAVMTLPLAVLAMFALLAGFLGTPAWPWFQAFLGGTAPTLAWHKVFGAEFAQALWPSVLVVFLGLGVGWYAYGRRPRESAEDRDYFEVRRPELYRLFHHKYYVDELYELTILRLRDWLARGADLADRRLWGGLVTAAGLASVALAWVSRYFDEWVINLGFDRTCDGLKRGGAEGASLQDGQIHHYLRVAGVALAVLLLVLSWGCSR